MRPPFRFAATIAATLPAPVSALCAVVVLTFFLLACVGPRAAAQVDLGRVKVGSSSTTTVSVIVITAGILGSISARMMGAENLDFTNAGGGTCTTNTGYPAGATCTVEVKFQPRLVGQRRGAVVLLDQSGNMLGTETCGEPASVRRQLS